MTTDERIELIDNPQFPSVLVCQECEHCGLISKDLSLSRISKRCSNCGKQGPRTLYPDVVPISLLKQVGHFYKAGYLAEQTQIEQLQNEIEGLTKKQIKTTTLRNCARQLKGLYRTGSEDEYKRMLSHVEKTLGIKEAIDKTLTKLVFFREIQPEYGVVIIYSCSMAERLLYDLLVELRCRCLNADRDAAHKIVDRRKGGLRDRLQLFEDMSDTDIEKLLVILGYKDWKSDWNKLRRYRNNILHKGAARIGASEAGIAFDFAINAPWVFGQLRNNLLGKSKS